ncbi:hypothetical protein SELMODRAFT_412462 [Selaginella moellendorffii]|uniref:Uncharacterized protein n=1 Tax=Selaginella moellendorffii TaxID=88036 RepID=D8RLK0_SELML|nr:hypothetical protein SELMODRAFT_412462 [Selaginella moellendorffii]
MPFLSCERNATKEQVEQHPEAFVAWLQRQQSPVRHSLAAVNHDLFDLMNSNVQLAPSYEDCRIACQQHKSCKTGCSLENVVQRPSAPSTHLEVRVEARDGPAQLPPSLAHQRALDELPRSPTLLKMSTREPLLIKSENGRALQIFC